MARFLIGLVVVVALLVAGVGAFHLSPRPGAWLVKLLFDHGAARTSQALEKHVPPDVETLADLPSSPNWPSLRLDVHRPVTPGARVLPTIVWVHGGGWLSGRKEDVANYLRVIAARGFVAVAVNYTLAPDAVHPTQLRQVHDTLVHLLGRADELGIDAARVVLAGDSAGAQIAAQLAAALADPAYAAVLDLPTSLPPTALRGVGLFCGPYDLRLFDYDGRLGPVLRTAMRAFTGRAGLDDNPAIDQASVLHHVSARFPPAFITVGNADPLLRHSQLLDQRLRDLGVPVDALYFPADRSPALGHEYQFNLDDPAGTEALERFLAFVHARTATPS